MLDHVHVNEKWFFISHDGERYILCSGNTNSDAESKEEVLYRSIWHERHNTKVMFPCAQVRPQYVPGKGQWWDGKLGICPIIGQ